LEAEGVVLALLLYLFTGVVVAVVGAGVCDVGHVLGAFRSCAGGAARGEGPPPGHPERLVSTSELSPVEQEL
jgi:hypothetical protein